MFHYVYCITNRLDNRRYIGCRSSRTLPELDTNYMGSSKSLTADINALGKEHFHKHIMCVCSTRKSALEIEIALHKFYDIARNPAFYNRAIQTSTGFDTSGTQHSEEHKQKISKANSGKVRTEEINLKNSLSHRGKKMLEENREKMYGRKLSAETRKRMSKARSGKVVSEETRRRISATKSAMREQISEKLRGRIVSEETRKKLSLANRGKKPAPRPLKPIDMELVIAMLSIGFSVKEVAKQVNCSNVTLYKRIKNYGN